MTTFSCVCFDTEGNAYTGGVNGQVYIWGDDNNLIKSVKGHSSEITAIIHEGDKLITGGKDGKVIVYSGMGPDLK